jgi:hypothetical protein
MGDNLGRGNAAPAAAFGQGQATGQRRHETGGIGIPGAGAIHKLGGLGADRMGLSAGDDQAALFAAGERGNGHFGPHGLGRGIEVISFIKGANLGFIGEDDIGFFLD